MSGTSPEWVPAFEGQRPPFEPGNEMALKHGAYSPHVVAALARTIVDQVLEQAALPGAPTAYLQDLSYRPALWDYATALAQQSRFAEALAQHGECEGCKRCHGWDEKLRRWQVTVMTHRQRLGMDPLSRARLGKDVAAAQVDLASLLSAERARLEAEARTVEGEASS